MNRKLKNKIANYLFMRQLRHHKRHHKSVSFQEAHKIGILYDATNEKNYDIIKNLVKEIRSHHKEVQALGYFNRKNLPANRFAKLGLDFFTKKSVNWYMKPGNPIVHNFIQTDFDILINLNIEKCFPLKYISAHSKAKFKIGRWDRRNAPICDMMIHTDENIPLAKFIEQIMHYLNLLRHDNLQKA